MFVVYKAVCSIVKCLLIGKTFARSFSIYEDKTINKYVFQIILIIIFIAHSKIN